MVHLTNISMHLSRRNTSIEVSNEYLREKTPLRTFVINALLHLNENEKIALKMVANVKRGLTTPSRKGVRHGKIHIKD